MFQASILGGGTKIVNKMKTAQDEARGWARTTWGIPHVCGEKVTE
jgi:hypothetical protein